MRSFFYSGIFILGISVCVLSSCASSGNSRFFSDQAYHYQTLRAFNDIESGGGDSGEILYTVKRITEGDPESWHKEWTDTAIRVLEHAETLKDKKSKGDSYLRAHNYFRTAEFFLPARDPKRLTTFDKSASVFYAGLDLLGIQYKRLKVPYGDRHLDAVYYPGPKGASEKPLIVVVGGFDSTLEELYFFAAKSGNLRGYNVLTYEGPGQGSALRHQNLTFTHEWEKPTSAVLDHFFKTNPKPKKTVLLGISLGGYLAPRAAAFDPRFDGVVAFDVMYDFGEVAERQIPSFIRWLESKGYNGTVNALVDVAMKFSPRLRWGVENGQWTMNTDSPADTMREFRKFTLKETASKIGQDVLILAGEKDHFVPVKQVEDFKKALTNARSVQAVIYEESSGGAEHCQLGASALWQADFFDWLKRFESEGKTR